MNLSKLAAPKLLISATTLTIFGLIICPQQAQAQLRGTRDGGGGNVNTAELASHKQLLEDTWKARRDLRNFFSSLEFGHRVLSNLRRLTSPLEPDAPEMPRYAELYDRLFPAQGADILTLLPKVRWTIREDGPCLDLKNREVDGSYGTEADGTPNICVSITRLDGRLTKYDAHRKILALMAHELTHFMTGPDERQPEFAQSLANEAGGQYLVARENEVSYSKAKDRFTAMLTAARQAIDANKSFSKICNVLTASYKDIDDLSDWWRESASFTMKFAPARAEAHMRMNAQFFTARGLIAGSCQADEWARRSRLGSKEENLADSIYKLGVVSPDMRYMAATVEPDERVMNVDFQDRVALVRAIELLEARQSRLDKLGMLRDHHP